MPEPWFPGAIRHYGRNAGYSSGRTALRAVVCHYTVGKNSDPIGVDGYFTWLVRRNGEIVQYAEADAVTWHAGEWNSEGPGIEIEHYPPDEADVFTPAARDACGALVRWLRDEWGFPGIYHDGNRLAAGDWHGFISHRSLQQSEQHSDYWPAEDFAAMVGTTPAPIHEKPEPKVLILNTDRGWMLYTPELGHAQGIDQETALWLTQNQGVPSTALSWDDTVVWSENAQTALARAVAKGVAQALEEQNAGR